MLKSTIQRMRHSLAKFFALLFGSGITTTLEKEPYKPSSNLITRTVGGARHKVANSIALGAYGSKHQERSIAAYGKRKPGRAVQIKKNPIRYAWYMTPHEYRKYLEIKYG